MLYTHDSIPEVTMQSLDSTNCCFSCASHCHREHCRCNCPHNNHCEPCIRKNEHHVTGITYTGATCFEPNECVVLCAKVSVPKFEGVSADNFGIPVTFCIQGREYHTLTTACGIASVEIGCLCLGCYPVTVCSGIHKVEKTINVMCQCPLI